MNRKIDCCFFGLFIFFYKKKIKRPKRMTLVKFDWPISTPQLNMLPCVHLMPIKRVLFPWPTREYSSWGGLPT